MKRIFMLCIMILFYHYASAQNIVRGKITDEKNQPLPGTSVFLPETDQGTIADNNGNYEFTNLPAGKLKIQFSFMGYVNRIETIILAGKVVELNVSLQPTVVKTDEIVISGGYSSTQHENAVKIEALKLDMLDIRTTPNFVDALRKVPGVDMISKGSGISKPVIRGLSMNDILVLNNGVRYENYQYSDHHPLGIDEFGIEDVEVIKGPASLLYGSDAIGGVINFIREKPAPMGTVEGDYSLQLFSNTLGITNNLGIKASSKKLFAVVRAGQKSDADFIQGGGSYAPNSRFNDFSLKSNFGGTSKAGTFKIFYDYNRQKLGMTEPEAIDMIYERGRRPALYYEELITQMLSSQNKLFPGKMKVDINSSYQNTQLIHFGEPGEYEIQMQLRTFTYETKVHLPSDLNSEYIIGFQGMNQVNSNINDRPVKLLPDAVTNNYSVFGLLQRTFLSKLKFQAGLRYDGRNINTDPLGVEDSSNYRPSINKRYGSMSGSTGLTYNITSKFLIRANFASAYRTPNLAELTSNGQHEMRYEVGDENLVPELSHEYDLSIHYHKENFTFDLAGFYNVINHYIYISPTGTSTPDGIPIYKYLQNNSRLWGGEAGVHYHPESMKWLHLQSTFASVVGKQSDGSYLPFIPAHKLEFEIEASKEKFLAFNKAFIAFNSHKAFDQNNAAPDETTTPGYTLFDLSAGGELKIRNQTILLKLGIYNLFDRKYIDHLSTLKEAGLFDPGRNITFSLKVPFFIKNVNP
jgi:iron complex outermembrane receptor protein